MVLLVDPAYVVKLLKITDRCICWSKKITDPNVIYCIYSEGGALSRTPVVTLAQPVSVSPAWLVNDMRHRAIMTPPATAMPQQMITPDVNATYTHVSNP